MAVGAATNNIYTDGSYLAKSGGTWHLEDAPFKARQITRMLARHPQIKPSTVCEIGCGAGGILAELQKALPGDVKFTGYDISPQAHAMSEQFANARCEFVLGEAFADKRKFDLVLVMDVVEHVEDYFSFLRCAREKGEWKLYHFPLDAHVSGILRGNDSWDSAGHLHIFTVETVLKALEHCGHRIEDWMFTNGALATPPKTVKARIANLLRAPLGRISTKLSARLLGGYSMLVLAR